MTTTQANRLTIEPVGDLDVVLTREFDAPRGRVFEMFTTAEHVRRWYGCRQVQTIDCRRDFRAGGEWAHTFRAPDGSTVGCHGRFVEIVPGAKIVQTFLFGVGDAPGEHACTETITFTDAGPGRTRLTTVVRHASRAERDTHFAAGMEHGATDAMDRLEELLLEQM